MTREAIRSRAVARTERALDGASVPASVREAFLVLSERYEELAARVDDRDHMHAWEVRR